MPLSDRKRRLLGRLSHRKTRERESAVLVEGVRGVGEILTAGANLRFVLVDPTLADRPEGPELLDRLRSVGAPVEEVEAGVLAEVADTESPQGVVAVCEQPRHPLSDVMARAPAGLLVLDAVQDPGNVGTLVRAAHAFGIGGVVALDGTVDLWSPKTVRAAAGALFHLPVVSAAWDGVADRLRESRVDLILAADGGEALPEATVPRAGWALVVGNEGRGARPEVVAAVDRTLTIPMPGGAESLNAAVAGSILLYALTVGAAR